METSDGISHEDWEEVRALSIDVVNAGDGDHDERGRLFDCLRELEGRYGRRPSLLATRADFLVDPILAKLLHLEAYQMACDSGDVANQWRIADPLFYLAVESGDAESDREEALHWLQAMERLAGENAFSPETLRDLDQVRVAYREF